MHTSLNDFFATKNVLVSAGATYEHIDPVRFIGNHSSGKMGIAIANAMAIAGANVYLLQAHTQVGIKIQPSVRIFSTPIAQSMYEQAMDLFAKMDIAVMAAAVADYTPRTYSTQKIKKDKNNSLVIHLTKTPDILGSLGAIKQIGQYLVGFALETSNIEKFALEKLQKKNCDMIIANELHDISNPVFGSDKNKIIILRADASCTAFALARKTTLAKHILRTIYTDYTQKLSCTPKR